MTDLNDSTVMSGIARAVARMGSQEKLAKHLGISQQAVSAWLKRGWVPPQRAREIEYHTGVVREHLLSPRLKQLFDIHDG